MDVAGKWKAVVTEIKRMNKTGRPVLVGTTSVEKSEMLAARLKDAEIRCQVGPCFHNCITNCRLSWVLDDTAGSLAPGPPPP